MNSNFRPLKEWRSASGKTRGIRLTPRFSSLSRDSRMEKKKKRKRIERERESKAEFQYSGQNKNTRHSHPNVPIERGAQYAKQFDTNNIVEKRKKDQVDRRKKKRKKENPQLVKVRRHEPAVRSRFVAVDAAGASFFAISAVASTAASTRPYRWSFHPVVTATYWDLLRRITRFSVHMTKTNESQMMDRSRQRWSECQIDLCRNRNRKTYEWYGESKVAVEAASKVLSLSLVLHSSTGGGAAIRHKRKRNVEMNVASSNNKLA